MAKRIQKRKFNVNQLTVNYKNLLNKYKRLIQIIKAKKENEYKLNYKYCPKKIYLAYDRIQNQKKLRKFNRKNLDVNKLKSLLNNLSSSKIKQKSKTNEHVNKIVNNKIGNKINESKFLQSVKNSIDNINKSWPKSKIKLLKEELNEIDYSNFEFDNPLSNLKIDSFLNLLLTPPNNF